jgi:hypothetical protein
MGRIGSELGVDAWAAHSAGLFEECGKAVMFRHATERYRPLLREAKNDEELLLLEHQHIGVSHDTLGAALCESWGLSPPAVDSVRYHVIVNSTLELPMHVQRRSICALSAMAHALMTDPDTLDEVARKVAPQAEIDPILAARGAAPGAGADRDGGRARQDRLDRAQPWARTPPGRRDLDRAPGHAPPPGGRCSPLLGATGALH